MSEHTEFELKDPVENKQTEETILERIVDEYVNRVEQINMQHKNEIPVEDQTRIGDLIEGGGKKENESYREWRMRREAEQLILEHYKKGVRGR